jgi:aubergine-like protein
MKKKKFTMITFFLIYKGWESKYFKMEKLVEQVDYCFPKRPSINKTGEKMNLATNFFKLTFLNTASKSYFKYAVDFEPEIPGDSVRLRSRIWRGAREEIKKELGHTLFNNTTCYSRENRGEIMTFKSTFESQSYSIIIKWASIIDNQSKEALSIYQRFFGQLVRRINFVQMRRTYFDPTQAKSVEGIELWPGFNSTINIYPSGVLLNINMLYKVLRPETALDVLKQLQQKFSNTEEFIQEVKAYFSNCVVLTRYNNDKTYVITDVEFSMTPKDKFKTKNDEVSYFEYYKGKYKKIISDINQPLLVHKDLKKNSTIYLIPEFCFLTGLTDEMRANFNTMKQMAIITKAEANEKMKECTNLIKTFLQNKKCQEDIENWGLTIAPQPITLTGIKLDAGNILMHKQSNGSRYSINIDNTPDIDRKIQTEMYSQPNLKTWAVRIFLINSKI